jgi:hypothetical protein
MRPTRWAGLTAIKFEATYSGRFYFAGLLFCLFHSARSASSGFQDRKSKMDVSNLVCAFHRESGYLYSTLDDEGQ